MHRFGFALVAKHSTVGENAFLRRVCARYPLAIADNLRYKITSTAPSIAQLISSRFRVILSENATSR
jgi:hypothetical protein